MIQFALYAYAGGPLIADYSSRIRGAVTASNNRGFAECKGFIPLGLNESFRLYDRPGMPHVLFGDTSSGAFYEGRLEGVNLTDGGVNVTAYGYARALSDFPYSALWSDTKVSAFRAVSNTEISNAANQQFTISTSVGAVTFMPNKGTAQGTSPTAYIAYMVYQIPDGSSRLITGISFDWTQRHGVGSAGHQWTAQVLATQAGYVSSTLLFTTGAGTNNGSRNFTFTGAPYIIIGMFWDGPNSDTPFNITETGNVFFAMRNIRIVTSVANRISTTLTVARAAGTNVTATVGSTAHMYVGQKLQIWPAIGGVEGESVTVLSIGSATQFNATFIAGSYAIGAAVAAHVVYSDEIVDDMVAIVAAVNPTQLSASTALVQSPAFDLTDQAWVDTYHADVLTALVALPDSQSRLWEWGIYSGQALYFRPQSSAGRTWYIDVSELDIDRTIDTLYNSVYPTYQDANGARLRGTPLSDNASIARYGVIRQKALSVSTTSITQANAQTAAALADSKDPPPRAGISVDRIFDANGQRWPLYYARSGDTIVIRNLPPTLSTTIDKIRIFRATRVEYAVDGDTLTIEPEVPRPLLDVLLAQLSLRG